MSHLARYYKALGVPEPVKLADATRDLWRNGIDVDEDAIVAALQRGEIRITDAGALVSSTQGLPR